MGASGFVTYKDDFLTVRTPGRGGFNGDSSGQTAGTGGAECKNIKVYAVVGT